MSDSMITKQAIAQGLKQLTKEKSFDKISISDITSICGLNRQTFYYHFEDKFELINWIYYNDIFNDLIQDITLDNWHKHFQALLETMKKEAWFYKNTIKCQQEYFEEYLFNITKELFMAAIEELDSDNKLEEEDKQFFSEFFTHGICGIVVDWVKRGMKEEPAHIARHAKQLAIYSEKAAYLRYIKTGETEE